MQRKIPYLLLSFFIIFSCRKPIDFNMQRQLNPDIIWAKCYGVSGISGELTDECQSISKTSDGGVIMCGTTNNMKLYSGETSGLTDNFYVVKADATGAVEWQRSYGGNGYDEAKSISATEDGDFYIAGNTVSNLGDVEGYHSAPSAPTDAWIIKIDKEGNLLWQKAFGGFWFDKVNSVKALPGGGCIFAGSTLSSDGDILGLKKGLWIVKLNDVGNIEWQKTYGSNAAVEIANCIELTHDGNYIVTGVAYGEGRDIKKYQGNTDAWVLKLSQSGNIIWENTFGGSGTDWGTSITSTKEGGYVFTGFTQSNNGDVTGLHSDKHVDYEDMWVVKLDGSGNLVWQKTLGGINKDRGNSIIETMDGNFIAIGFTTDFYGQDNYSRRGRRGSVGADAYAVKLSPWGSVIWEKQFAGSKEDIGTGIIETNDGNVIFGGTTSSTDFDIFGNHGWLDFWLVKFKG